MKLDRRLSRALSIASALTLPQAAFAGDDVRASADISPTLGYSSDPFAEVGSNRGSAYVRLEVLPLVRVISENSVIALSGRLNLQHYFHNYAGTNDYSAAVDYTGHPTARLSTHAQATYDSSIIGGFEAIGTTIDPTQPPPPVTTAPDLALFGTRARRVVYKVAGDLGYSLSDRASLTVNAYYNQSHYGSLGPQSSYATYGGGAGYSRKISDHLQLGAQVLADRTVYQGVFGQSQVYSLQATFADSISSRWDVNGAVGASYSERSIRGNSFSPTGHLQLCRTGPRAALCVIGSEAVQPTGYSGTVVSRSLGATYSYKLSELSGISVTGNYSHNGHGNQTILGNGFVGATSYYSASGTYDRTLRERLHGIITTQYRVIRGGFGGQRTDILGSAGFTVKLGDYK